MRANTRAAVYSWMNKWLRDQPGAVTEPELQVELEENLNVTPTGQVSTSLGGDTASTLNIKRFSALRSSPADLPVVVKRLTRFVYTAGAPAVQTISQTERDGVQTETVTYEAEPGRNVPAVLYAPKATRRGTVLLVDRIGKNSPVAAELARAGYHVLAIDAALMGETASGVRGYADQWFPEDKSIWLALMVGRTVTGLRITDIRKGLDFLEVRSLLPPQGVVGMAIGNGSVAVLHAAVVDKRLGRLVLEDMPPPYRVLATTPVQRQVFDVVIPMCSGTTICQTLRLK